MKNTGLLFQIQIRRILGFLCNLIKDIVNDIIESIVIDIINDIVNDIVIDIVKDIVNDIQMKVQQLIAKGQSTQNQTELSSRKNKIKGWTHTHPHTGLLCTHVLEINPRRHRVRYMCCNLSMKKVENVAIRRIFQKYCRESIWVIN